MYKINLNFQDHKLHEHYSKVHIKMGRKSHSSVCNEDYVNCLGAISFFSLTIPTPKASTMEPWPYLHPPCQKETAVGENQVNEEWEKTLRTSWVPETKLKNHPRRLSDCNSHISGTIKQQIIQLVTDNFWKYFLGDWTIISKSKGTIQWQFLRAEVL